MCGQRLGTGGDIHEVWIQMVREVTRSGRKASARPGRGMFAVRWPGREAGAEGPWWAGHNASSRHSVRGRGGGTAAPWSPTRGRQCWPQRGC